MVVLVRIMSYQSMATVDEVNESRRFHSWKEGMIVKSTKMNGYRSGDCDISKPLYNKPSSE